MITRPYSKMDTDAAERQMKKLKDRHSMLEAFFGLNQDKQVPTDVNQMQNGGNMGTYKKWLGYQPKIKHETDPELNPWEKKPSMLDSNYYDYLGRTNDAEIMNKMSTGPTYATGVLDDSGVTTKPTNHLYTGPTGPTSDSPPAKVPWGDIGMGVASNLGNLANLYYGLTKKDKVKFDRVSPSLVDYKPQQGLLRNQLGSSLATLKSNIKGAGAQSSGALLSNLATGSSELYKNFGEMSSQLGMTEANTNAQIKNVAGAQNAGIQMQESIAKQQEKDARRSAVAKGLAGISDYTQIKRKDKNAEKLTKEQWAFLLKYGKFIQPQNGGLYEDVQKNYPTGTV